MWISCKSTTGGAIYTNHAGSTLGVISCYFEDCYASTDFGGAIATEGLNTVHIFSSSFVLCHGEIIPNPDSGGGAVYITATSNYQQIDASTFINCYSGADGGAVLYRYSTVTGTDGIVDTKIIGCRSTFENMGVQAGAMQSYGGYLTSSLSNCLISKCSSIYGGGLYLLVKGNSVTNIIAFCFFSDNSATSTGNDVTLESFSTNYNQFFLCSCSTSPSCRVAYYVSSWIDLDDNWLFLTYNKIDLYAELTNKSTYSTQDQ